MICALTRKINEAATDYKRKYCAADAINLRECIRLTRGGKGDARFPNRFAKNVC